MKELALYFTPNNTPDAMKLRGIMVRMGIRVRNITPEDFNQKVGYLAEVPGYEDPEDTENMPVTIIDEEMLVMHRFSNGRIDELLKKMKDAKIPRVNMKAVVTENNCGWTFTQLYEEIAREHQKMHDPE